MNKPSNLQAPDGTIAFRGHIVELDALRALGIGLVLINHFWIKSLSAFVFSIGQFGWVAMDSFFVLSGFLIAGILLDTRGKPGFFRNFYARRSLRIFPLYYVALFLLIALLYFSRHGSEYATLLQTWGSPWWFAVYLGNFKSAIVGKVIPLGGLGPLWSLQVEEQFYMLFPLAVWLLRIEHLSRLLWSLVFLSPLLRLAFYLWDPQNVCLQYELLPCHMEGLALGALIAIRVRRGPWKIHKPTLTALMVGILLVTCIGSFLSTPTVEDWAWTSPFNRLVGYSLSSWGCACLILWLILFRDTAYTRWARFAPLQYIGKISYGIYLLHPAVFRLYLGARKYGLHLRYDGFPHFVFLVVASVLLASLSWYAFERPILSLKDRIVPRCDRSPVCAPADGAAAERAMAPVQPVALPQ